MQYITNSETETKKIAQTLAGEFKGRIIALSGELGAGKTTFVQGFAKGLGIKEKIISPTFVLIRPHKIPNMDITLCHIDLYRLEDTGQTTDLGLEELMENPKNILLIEWAEKLPNLPKNTTWVKIEKKENTRIITVF